MGYSNAPFFFTNLSVTLTPCSSPEGENRSVDQKSWASEQSPATPEHQQSCTYHTVIKKYFKKSHFRVTPSSSALPHLAPQLCAGAEAEGPLAAAVAVAALRVGHAAALAVHAVCTVPRIRTKKP